MKRTKINAQMERQLITALIVSKLFLGQATTALQKEREHIRKEAPLFYLITGWCIDYFDEYQDAPKAHVETIYHSWADENENTELVDSVHDFLEDLSGQYNEIVGFNIPFLLDTLSEFLTKKKLHTLQENLDGLLLRGQTAQALEAVSDYRHVELGQSAGIDPLNDDEAWERAFAEPYESLITFPGPAGLFFNSALTRDAFVAIQAPEKTGKTFWCIELMMRALRERRKVAVFEVGDLSEGQFMLRMGVRLTSRPARKEFCGRIKIPQVILKSKETDEGGATKTSYSMECLTERKRAPVNNRAVLRARKNFLKSIGVSAKNTYVQVSTHPNSSINVKGISAILDTWAVEKNFVPDVIIIDYADILAPEDVRKDARAQVNDTWKALRRLSQERHALVIVPTQADAGTYGRKGLQGMQNFSEDKRKLAHVTGMFALNQTAEEKDQQMMRLNWIVLREAPFNISRCLAVGTCFPLGKAFCCATL